MQVPDAVELDRGLVLDGGQHGDDDPVDPAACPPLPVGHRPVPPGPPHHSSLCRLEQIIILIFSYFFLSLSLSILFSLSLSLLFFFLSLFLFFISLFALSYPLSKSSTYLSIYLSVYV